MGEGKKVKLAECARRGCASPRARASCARGYPTGGPETERTPSGARNQLPISPPSGKATGERGRAMRETRGRSKKSPRVIVSRFERSKNKNIFSQKNATIRNKRPTFALDKTQPFPFPVALRRPHSVQFRGPLPDGTAQTIFDLINTTCPITQTEYPPGTCAFR